MGNILNSQSNIKLINHLNNFHIKVLNQKEHQELEKFRSNSKLKQNNMSLFTTYSYQKIGGCLPTNFILCKSSTVNEIIKNTLIGEESIAYLCWNYDQKEKVLFVKDILENLTLSSNKIDLIEIHSIKTSKSCKTLRFHPHIKKQDNQTCFSESYIINGIMDNFVIYPIKKILLNNLDVKSNILNLYIGLLYSF
jgi:hypothetical protein